MRRWTNQELTILHTLADGNYHTGSELGLRCQVSRTAIWKHMNKLIQMGVPIVSHSKLGYRYDASFYPLTEQKIVDNLIKRNFDKAVDLHLYASIDSTNVFLKSQIGAKLSVCCAETQTQGRGRFGRSWHSPFGHHIYCSSKWVFSCNLTELQGLSLVISLAIVETLKEFNILHGIAIKWPNDILWQNKKLCGILIELIAESHHQVEVIIGVGLNVNSPLINPSWCCLFDILNENIDRNELIAAMICRFDQYLNLFMNKGLNYFLPQWHQYDYLYNKPVQVMIREQTYRGIAVGIDEQGQLIYRMKMEQKEKYHQVKQAL